MRLKVFGGLAPLALLALAPVNAQAEMVVLDDVAVRGAVGVEVFAPAQAVANVERQETQASGATVGVRREVEPVEVLAPEVLRGALHLRCSDAVSDVRASTVSHMLTGDQVVGTSPGRPHLRPPSSRHLRHVAADPLPLVKRHRHRQTATA